MALIPECWAQCVMSPSKSTHTPWGHTRRSTDGHRYNWLYQNILLSKSASLTHPGQHQRGPTSLGNVADWRCVHHVGSTWMDSNHGATGDAKQQSQCRRVDKRSWSEANNTTDATYENLNRILKQHQKNNPNSINCSVMIFQLSTLCLLCRNGGTSTSRL